MTFPIPTLAASITPRRKKLPVALLALLLSLVVGAAAASVATDLAVVDVTANKVAAAPGEQVLVSARVVNLGGLASEASRLKYYWSADATFDAADTYLNYDNVGALGASEFEDESANVRVPVGTVDGVYYVLVIADFDDVVTEIDESNNVYALPLEVGDVTVEHGPDLVIESPTLSAARADADTVVAAACSVHNDGDEAAVETRLKYYLSTDDVFDATDTYLNYDAVGPLAAGSESPETANLRVPAGTPDGAFYVLFVADQTELLTEPDEANNVAALLLLVGDYQAAADLVLEDVAVPVPSVRAGETLTVSATAVNAGSAPSGVARLVYFLSDDGLLDASDKQLSFDQVDALALGAASPENAELRVSEATYAGNYFVLFVLDADDAVSESNEDNNVVAVAVEVTADDPNANKPDLVLTSATLASPVVAAGDQLLASATVENVGVAAAEASRLKYFLSTDALFDAGDTYLNYDAVEALAVGAASPESANLRIPAGTPNGTYFVLFVADETRAVAERYESNNVVSLSFTVGVAETSGPGDQPGAALPDYRVTSASLVASEVRAGERAELACRVENVGDYAASAASRVKYYLSRDTTFSADDDYLGYDNVPALAPGASSDETATPLIGALTSHGRWYVLLVADAAADVAETFESNNVRALALDVVVDDPSLDAPDLEASDVVSTPALAGAGLKLDVSATIHNAGSRPAVSSRAKLYLSSDASHDESDVYLGYRDLDGIDVDDSASFVADVRIPMLTPDGPTYLLLVLDTERVMTEQYESNNVLASPLVIGAATPPSYPYACPASVFTDATLLGKHTVASLNALHLGQENNKDMLALACIVSHFDLVGLVEIYDPAGVLELELAVEALTGEAWSHHVSPTAVGNENAVEFYAYLWRSNEVSMSGALGFYDDPNDDIKRDPYGANFVMGAFDFTFVVFHQQYGNSMAIRRHEGEQLIDVYDYFQALNGAEGDVLIGGDFNLPGDDEAFTLVGYDGISYITDPEQLTSIGHDGLASSFDNIFFPAPELSELIGSGAHDYTMANWDTVVETVTDHIPVWAEFDITSDDD